MRRRLWRTTIIVAAAALLATAARAFWLEPASLTIAEQRIELPWASGRPLRIAVLADLHVGSPFVGVDKLRRIVDETNDAHPDLICLLGDFVIQGVTGGHFVDPETIAAELRRLRSPAGVFSVLGNHDGWLDHDRVQRALERNGIRVIEERAERLETVAGPIWLAGISDYWSGRSNVGAALAGIKDANTPVILLTHNPDVFPEVPARVTITLAGHTHGGQVYLPLIGRPVVPSRFGQRYAAGHIVEGGRHLFVATGIGTSIFPVRFRVPPVVTLLTLAPERR